MAVSADGAPPGGAGVPASTAAQTTAAAPAEQTTHASPTSRASHAFTQSVPSPPQGAEDVLRRFVRSSVEKILKEAPWTFNKVNPLKEACREFLREVDAVDGARELAVDQRREPSSTTAEAFVREDLRRKKLTLLATKALVAACDSGRPALADHALGAAHKLVAAGFLAGTTGARTPKGVKETETVKTAKEPEAKGDDDTETAMTDAKETTTTSDEKNDAEDVAAFDASCAILVRSFCACASHFPDGASSASSTHVAAVGALLACAVSETFRLEGEALADALSALLRVAVAAAPPETRAAAKAATTQLINVTFRRARFIHREHTMHEHTNEIVSSVIEQRRESDALLVLLTLCERASVPGSGETKARETETARRLRSAESSSSSDPFAAMATAFTGQTVSALVASETRNNRTRAVSLDLLRQLLEGPGSEKWLEKLAPRLGKPLRAALAAGVETEGTFGGESSGTHSGNTTAQHARASAPTVARADPATLATASLARAAFTSLVLRARRWYKPEIGKLYPRMALFPLEGQGGGSSGVFTSANSSPNLKAKLAALRVIRALASDPQVLVDVFVNHDCDARGDNLYERTVSALASTMAPGGGDQQRLRDGAVQCVLAVVRSLRAWHARGDGVGTDVGTGTPVGDFNSKDDAGDAIDAIDVSRRQRRVAAEDDESLLASSETSKEKEKEKQSSRSLSESETFASLKKLKATLEAATSAFNARPSVLTLAAVMEIASDKDASEVDVVDPGFPKRAAAFLIGAGEGNGEASGEASGEAIGEAASRRRQTRRSKPPRRGLLDPSAVGELLGSHDVDALRVMKAYADAHDFAGLEFDEALRVFFRSFRVPGEAQKIDRLVERFAERHCECNPQHFSDSDQAYVLAFAVVMLNTDAHNPKTDPNTKMSEDTFVAMAREGMSAGGHGAMNGDRPGGPHGGPTEASKKYASDDALRGLFRRVVAEEIEMSPGLHERKDMRGASDVHSDEDEVDEDDASAAIAATVSGLADPDASRRRRDDALAAAVTETEAVLLRTRELFVAGSRSSGGSASTGISPFFAASDPSLARPMLETAGPPLLRAVSRAFANADDAAHAALPLEGARAIVVLSSTLNLPALRDGLCDFLARAPGLGLGSDGVGRHAVEAARTLLDLAAEASGLGEENWPVILEVVSRMDALREAATVASERTSDVHSEEGSRVTENQSYGRIVNDLVKRYASSDSEDESEDVASRHEDGVARLARLVACARAPLRFARGEASSSRDGRVSSGGKVTEPPISPTPAELALGTWLASAEGANASRRVFENAARFDDVEATGFVAALAGVAVADAWAPAREPRERDAHANESRFSENTNTVVDKETAAAVASMPFPSPCPRAFSLQRLAETTARALERPRAVRAEIWSARVAPVLAGMAAHPDGEIVRAAAEGLYASAARFAARAEHGGSPAALASAFAPFADAHRWATLAEYRVGDAADHASSPDLSVSSRLARKLTAASCGLCVKALASGKPKDAPLSMCELAGWRASLSVLKRFASDPDESVSFAALDAATGAVVETAARVVKQSAVSVTETETAKKNEDEDGENVSCERAFAEDASAALLAFAARRNLGVYPEGDILDASSSSAFRRVREKKPNGAASRAAAVCLRDVAVAAAEAMPRRGASSVGDTPPLAGERVWRACVDALASAASVAEEERKPKIAISQRDVHASKLASDDSNESVFALEHAFDILHTDVCVMNVSSASFHHALNALALHSLDVDARVKATASAKETWETTTRRATKWCVERAPVATRGFVKLVYFPDEQQTKDEQTAVKDVDSVALSRKRRLALLSASFPHSKLPAMASSAVLSADFSLLDVVCVCAVELAQALAATAAEDDGDESLEKVRLRAWRGVAAALEVTATNGVAAVCRERESGLKFKPPTGKQSEVSSAGAYAATAACDAALKILRFECKERAVPGETRIALLDVLAKTHAAAAKANGNALKDAIQDGAKNDAANASINASIENGDFLVRLETFAGASLVEALRFEAERKDASSTLSASMADRLGATCAAILEGIVAIASPPPFILEDDEKAIATEDDEKATEADVSWLASAAFRRDAGLSREPLATLSLDALVSLRHTHARVFFRRAGAATASAAALVAVARRPLCAAVGKFFDALATSPSWSFEGTRSHESESRESVEDVVSELDEISDASPRSEDEGVEEGEGDERLFGGDANDDDATLTATERKRHATRPPSHL